MQKMDFPFEIIIHDDASTDATADIIREYEMKYPDIIKAIFQIENQYSKGKKVFPFTFMAARGKYIALCEGDDYWIDPLKLQKQTEIMEKYPDCCISFHPAIIRRFDETIDNRMLGFYSEKTMIFPAEKVILGGGGFMHTGSIMLNRLVIPRIISFFNIAKEARSEDYYLQVLGAEHGGALYLSDVMSVYRSSVPGSWTAMMRNDQNFWASHYRSIIICNNKMNDFTENKYSHFFNIQNKKLYSGIIRTLYPDIDTKKIILDKYINEIDTKDKILWNFLFKRPYVIKFLKTVRSLGLKVKGSP
jgi:glycosyltransferase involved in cell wall biosynthesis